MKKRGGYSSVGFWGSVLVGTGICLGISLLLALLTAVLTDKGILPLDGMGIAGIVNAGLSGLLGSALAAGRTRKRKLPAAVGTGALYLCVLLLVFLAVAGGRSPVHLGASVGAVLAAAAAAGFLCAREKQLR